MALQTGNILKPILKQAGLPSSLNASTDIGKVFYLVEYNALWVYTGKAVSGGTPTPTTVPPSFSNGVVNHGSGQWFGLVSAGTVGNVLTASKPSGVNQLHSSWLPSYVDDIIEAYTRNSTKNSSWLSLTNGGSALTPETGKIYVIVGGTESAENDKTYRWSGSTWVSLSSPTQSLATLTDTTGINYESGRVLRANGSAYTSATLDTLLGVSINGILRRIGTNSYDIAELGSATLTLGINGTDRTFGANATSNVDWTDVFAPTTAGTANQVSKSDGSGAPTWSFVTGAMLGTGPSAQIGQSSTGLIKITNGALSIDSTTYLTNVTMPTGFSKSGTSSLTFSFSSNYSLHRTDAKMTFGTGGSTTFAPLNIAQTSGTITSPANGDFWHKGNEIHAYLNSTDRTLLHSGSSIAVSQLANFVVGSSSSTNITTHLSNRVLKAGDTMTGPLIHDTGINYFDSVFTPKASINPLGWSLVVNASDTPRFSTGVGNPVISTGVGDSYYINTSDLSVWYDASGGGSWLDLGTAQSGTGVAPTASGQYAYTTSFGGSLWKSQGIGFTRGGVYYNSVIDRLELAISTSEKDAIALQVDIPKWTVIA